MYACALWREKENWSWKSSLLYSEDNVWEGWGGPEMGRASGFYTTVEDTQNKINTFYPVSFDRDPMTPVILLRLFWGRFGKLPRWGPSLGARSKQVPQVRIISSRINIAESCFWHATHSIQVIMIWGDDSSIDLHCGIKFPRIAMNRRFWSNCSKQGQNALNQKDTVCLIPQ